MCPTRPITRLLVLLLTPAALGATARIEGIVEDDLPVDHSSRVHCLRATDVEERRITVGMELDVDDVLEARADGVRVRLACGAKTRPDLTGRFVVAILEPGDDDCAIRLDDGRADLTTSLPARVEGGGVVLGNRATQYAVDRRPAGGFPPRAMAFDGAVYAVSAAGRTSLASGFSLDVPDVGILGAIARIAQHDLRRSAASAAWLDVAEAIHSRGARIGEPVVAAAELEGLHYAVLADPRDARARQILVDAQTRYRLYDRAAYHRQRLEQLHPGGAAAALADTVPRRREPPPFYGPPPAPGGADMLAGVHDIFDRLEPPPEPPRREPPRGPEPRPEPPRPDPKEPEPAEPEPAEPEPAEPEPGEPEPAEPEPGEPEPDPPGRTWPRDPERAKPDPAEPRDREPEDPRPSQPTDPEPRDPMPNEPDPVEGEPSSRPSSKDPGPSGRPRPDPDPPPGIH